MIAPINAPMSGNKCMFLAHIFMSVSAALGTGIIVKNERGANILLESKNYIPPSNQ